MRKQTERERAKLIELNDRFRRQAEWREIPGVVIFSKRIHELPQRQRRAILEKLRNVEFPVYESPDSEHQIGEFDVPGVGRIFWGIRYLDYRLLYDSKDPANLTITVRVLRVRFDDE